ncbi:MAG: PIN domain-containing protein [Candidatus Norongarragalinales archaeon]
MLSKSLFMIVLLDTNILLAPGRSRLDVLSEIEKLLDRKPEYVVLSPCFDEIKSLAAGKSRNAPAARVALKIVKESGVRVVQAKGKPDEAILEWAKANAALKPLVCTNDAALKKLLRKAGVRVACVREKNRMAFC